MRDATDDPLWRSDVWLRNPFSIQRGEEKGEIGDRGKMGGSGGKSRSDMKESRVNESEAQNGNMSLNNI